MKRDPRPGLSLTARLLGMNILVWFAFGVIILFVLLSFQHIRALLTTDVDVGMRRIIAGAETGRRLSSIFSDTGLLTRTFARNEPILEREGRRLTGAVEAIAGDMYQPELADSVGRFGRHLAAALAQCEVVNARLRVLDDLDREILSALDLAGERLSASTMDLVLAGGQTDILEGLAATIGGCRELALEAGKLRAGLDNNHYSAPLEQEQHPELAVLESLGFKLRTLAASGLELAEVVGVLAGLVDAYGTGLAGYHVDMAELKRRFDWLELSKVEVLADMQALDQAIGQAVGHVNGRIQDIVFTSGSVVLALSLTMIIAVGLLTAWFIVTNIKRPVEAISRGIASLGQGDLKSRITLGRDDEWGLIEQALNRMAADLDGLYAEHREKNTELEAARSELEAKVLELEEQVEARKRAEEALLHKAFHDDLTGLPNRALFMDRLRLSCSRTRRHPERMFAILYLDLDRFKVINDSLGHLAGDRLLLEIAGRLGECVRTADTLARLGGDEFAVLLDEVGDLRDAVRVAERIESQLALPFSIHGRTVYTGASLGIVLGTAACAGHEDILRDADTAMYRAKTLGRGRYEVFEATMHDQVRGMLQLETDLRQAMARGEFTLHYQPILSLETGRLLGFEALARWEHPEHGMIPPNRFIPLAEEIGLIVPLGRWVLREACVRLQEWTQRHGGSNALEDLAVSVNLSARQFLQHDLAAEVEAVLAETGLPGRRLILEITESVLMEHSERVVAMLERLQALGARIAIDDFGTGYSSLAYLHSFPFDILKIDRSFVSGVGAADRDFIPAIVSLAHGLGKSVVAEGVETAEQWGRLKALGCQSGQGYFFGRPTGAAEAEEWIAMTAGAAGLSEVG